MMIHINAFLDINGARLISTSQPASTAPSLHPDSSSICERLSQRIASAGRIQHLGLLNQSD